MISQRRISKCSQRVQARFLIPLYGWTQSNSASGFAANVGILFKTPEEFFLGQDPVEASGLFDPKEYIETQPETGMFCFPRQRFGIIGVQQID